jgi:hypothetical protein
MKTPFLLLSVVLMMGYSMPVCAECLGSDGKVDWMEFDPVHAVMHVCENNEWVMKPMAGYNIGTNLKFTSATFRPDDPDHDGKFDFLKVTVAIDILQDGDYVISSDLYKKYQGSIANKPFYKSRGMSDAYIVGKKGDHLQATLTYSGNQIRESQRDGPYYVFLSANGVTGLAGRAYFQSQPFKYDDFQEND